MSKYIAPSDRQRMREVLANGAGLSRSDSLRLLADYEQTELLLQRQVHRIAELEKRLDDLTADSKFTWFECHVSDENRKALRKAVTKGGNTTGDDLKRLFDFYEERVRGCGELLKRNAELEARIEDLTSDCGPGETIGYIDANSLTVESADDLVCEDVAQLCCRAQRLTEYTHMGLFNLDPRLTAILLRFAGETELADEIATKFAHGA